MSIEEDEQKTARSCTEKKKKRGAEKDKNEMAR
jgi:hypothetical protein